MPRVLLTIVLPLMLPTTLYLLWVIALRPSPGETPWATLPWLWLAGAGVVLLVIVLFVVTIYFGSSQQGVYVPPRWENGHIIPGHMEPASSR